MGKNDLPTVGSFFGLLASGLTAFGFGLLLGAVYLVITPVSRVDRMPIGGREDAYEGLFLRGSDLRGSHWQAKLTQMMSASTRPRSVTFTEGDINLFLRQSMQGSQQNAENVRVVPNVDISNGQLQLALIFYIQGRDAPLYFQMRGAVKQGRSGFYYSPTRCYIGNLPLPAPLAKLISDSVLRQTFSSNEAVGIREVWSALDEVSIDGNSMQLRWL